MMLHTDIISKPVVKCIINDNHFPHTECRHVGQTERDHLVQMKRKICRQTKTKDTMLMETLKWWSYSCVLSCNRSSEGEFVTITDLIRLKCFDFVWVSCKKCSRSLSEIPAKTMKEREGNIFFIHASSFIRKQIKKKVYGGGASTDTEPEKRNKESMLFVKKMLINLISSWRL